MENYICPICGDIIDSIYDEVNQCLRLSCCGEKYNEDEFEITKMTKNYVWRSHYDYKLCTLCEAIVLYHRLKNNYSPNSPIILYIGIEENSIIKDFLTQNLF